MLFIRVGRLFEPIFAHLNEVADARGFDPTTTFLDVSAEAVGNLSHPVDVLKQRMFGDISSALSKLLQRVTGQTEGFILDVVILTAHGEPMATNAAKVVIDATSTILRDEFGPVFPRDAGWQVICIGLSPRQSDLTRPRREMLAEIADFVRAMTSRQDEKVTRIFLLDCATPQGISNQDDLLAQAESLAMFLAFSGLRREQIGVQLFEAPTSDLLATVGIGRLETPPKWFERKFRERLWGSIQATIKARDLQIIPPHDGLVSQADFESDKHRAALAQRLEEFCVQTLDERGFAALWSLAQTWDQLDRCIDAMAEAARVSNLPSKVAPAKGVGFGVRSALILTAGAGAFGIAYFAAGLAIVLSSGIALVVAAIGAIAVALMIRAPTLESENPSQHESSEPHPEEIAATLKRQCDVARQKVARICAQVEATQGASIWAQPTPHDSNFVMHLVSDDAADALFEVSGGAGDAQAGIQEWIASVGTWAAILRGDAILTKKSLEQFVELRSQEIDLQELMANPVVRSHLQPVIRRWQQHWAHGINLNLEIQTLQSRDLNGFREVAANEIFCPPGARIDATVAGHTLEDYFCLSAVTDVAVEATLVLENP